MTRSSLVMAVVLLAGGAPGTAAQTTFTADVWGGTALSMNSNVTIVQQGHPDLRFTAAWETRPLEDAWYYAGRAGFWRKDRGWALEFIHHKVYLTNNPPEVQEFKVTFGYNLLTVARRWRRGHTNWGVGGGVVVGHPVTTVRGKELPPGDGILQGLLGKDHFFIGGPTAIGSIGRQYNMIPWVHLSLEAKLSATWARFPIADGHATVPNVALHLLAGLGLDLP